MHDVYERMVMTRRIAYLLSQYPTYNHTFLLREVRALRALGVEVDVASLTSPDRAFADLPIQERDESSRCAYIKKRGAIAALASVLGWVGRSPLQFWSAARLALRLSSGGARRRAAHVAYLGQACLVADWLVATKHARLHCHFSSTVAMLAARLAGIPWSLTIHGPGEFDDIAAFGLVEKVASAERVVVISGFARSQVLRHVSPALWERVVVVPLGIAPADYLPPPDQSPGRCTELLTVGRLAPVKAQALLIDAVAMLCAEGCSVRLRIVGTGPDREMLKAKIVAQNLVGHVELVGPLPPEAVTKLYAETDIFALPSFAEGVPVVLMEAMAMRRPCVASRIMGIPELIEDERDGLLVRPADVVDVVRAIRTLIEDPALRVRIGVAARERVVRDYDIDVNVARLADVLMQA
jgi:colanic acid/amylovoran biosynthesis glycosyltransferase